MGAEKAEFGIYDSLAIMDMAGGSVVSIATEHVKTVVRIDG